MCSFLQIAKSAKSLHPTPQCILNPFLQQCILNPFLKQCSIFNIFFAIVLHQSNSDQCIFFNIGAILAGDKKTILLNKYQYLSYLLIKTQFFLSIKSIVNHCVPTFFLLHLVYCSLFYDWVFICLHGNNEDICSSKECTNEKQNRVSL